MRLAYEQSWGVPFGWPESPSSYSVKRKETKRLNQDFHFDLPGWPSLVHPRSFQINQIVLRRASFQLGSPLRRTPADQATD